MIYKNRHYLCNKPLYLQSLIVNYSSTISIQSRNREKNIHTWRQISYPLGAQVILIKFHSEVNIFIIMSGFLQSHIVVLEALLARIIQQSTR